MDYVIQKYDNNTNLLNYISLATCTLLTMYSHATVTTKTQTYRLYFSLFVCLTYGRSEGF